MYREKAKTQNASSRFLKEPKMRANEHNPHKKNGLSNCEEISGKSLSVSQSCVLGRKMRARAHLKGQHVTDGDAHRVVRRSNRAGLVLDAPVSKQDVNANANANVNVNVTASFPSPVEDEERVHRLQQDEAREQPMRC